MNLRLIKASEEYRSQISDMMEEWNSFGEKIVPYIQSVGWIIGTLKTTVIT